LSRMSTCGGKQGRIPASDPKQYKYIYIYMYINVYIYIYITDIVIYMFIYGIYTEVNIYN
jgi:hypothetical protein